MKILVLMGGPHDGLRLEIPDYMSYHGTTFNFEGGVYLIEHVIGESVKGYYDRYTFEGKTGG